jgi:NDP-sugar pyrophosphorylase family protein
MDVAAAILAGGLGTRLRPVLADRPKVLAPVGGRPFLTYLLDQLAGASVREVILLAGHSADRLRSALGAMYEGMRLVYSIERSPLGTGGALRLALPRLATPTVLLLNGDSFCDVDLTAFRRSHRAGASLVLSRVTDASRFGQVRLGADGRVERFEEKAAGGGPGWVSTGVYLIDRALIEEIPSGRMASLEHDLMPAWVARRCVHGFCCDGRFVDIGTPPSYDAAQGFFAVTTSL